MNPPPPGPLLQLPGGLPSTAGCQWWHMAAINFCYGFVPPPPTSSYTTHPHKPCAAKRDSPKMWYFEVNLSLSLFPHRCDNFEVLEPLVKPCGKLAAAGRAAQHAGAAGEAHSHYQICVTSLLLSLPPPSITTNHLVSRAPSMSNPAATLWIFAAAGRVA